MGIGESQVIAHGLLGSRWVVLDDLAARRCATAHGLPVIGTLGLVLRSKKNQHVESARSLVEELLAAGMFLHNEFAERILASVGE